MNKDVFTMEMDSDERKCTIESLIYLLRTQDADFYDRDLNSWTFNLIERLLECD
jgi:hypothetical protein